MTGWFGIATEAKRFDAGEITAVLRAKRWMVVARYKEGETFTNGVLTVLPAAPSDGDFVLLEVCEDPLLVWLVRYRA